MRVVITAVLALLCSAPSALAQLPGERAGSIYDQTGARLAGVRVALSGMTDRETQTSAAGDFAFKTFPKVTTRFPLN